MKKKKDNTLSIVRKIYKLRPNPMAPKCFLLYDTCNEEYVNKMWNWLEKDFRGKDLREYKNSKEILIWLNRYFYLTKSFMRKYADVLNWTCISMDQKLSEKFIDEMKDYVNWEEILERQTFSEKWIRKNAHWFEHMHWYHLSMNKKIHLSESFLREYKDELEWCYLSEYYDFTKDFLREMSDKVYYRHFSYNNKTHLKEEEFKEFTLGMDYDKIKKFDTLKDVLYR